MRSPSLSFPLFAIFAAILAAVAQPLSAQVEVQLAGSLPSPQPLGTPVTWTASASVGTHTAAYQFEVARAPVTGWTMLRDFTTTPSIVWVPSTVEGVYQIRVTARDITTGETGQALSGSFTVNTLVQNKTGIVSPTTHPLVALFSAPTCPIGSTMQVTFRRVGAPSTTSQTDARPCHAGSMNFYIAGMLPSSSYQMMYAVTTHGTVVPSGTWLPFTSGAAGMLAQIPVRTVEVPAGSNADTAYRISLSSYAPPDVPAATDLSGRLLWYYPYTLGGQLVRTLGSSMLLIITGPGIGDSVFGAQSRQQILQKIDLAGNVLWETSADRISEQTMRLGNTDPLARFNHDAILLPNGNYIALLDTQRAFPAGTQGSPVPIDIIGEVIVELDPNLNVLWYWNVFDHDDPDEININRAAIRGEYCALQANGQTPIGCPPALLPGFTVAYDWLHANAVQLLSDGNLLLSLRDQDWIVKIDYDNGSGNGQVLWRLGLGGDFTIVSNDAYPWFSGQHEPAYFNPTALALFDNGNTRVLANGGGDSRGMAFTIDETNKVLTTILSADLGVFCNSQGSAQLLPNGNYHFQPGIVDNEFMQSLEVTPSVPNPIVFNLQGQDKSYRTFRMPDMYTPPY